MAETFIRNFLTDNSLNEFDFVELRSLGAAATNADLTAVSNELLISDFPGNWVRMQFEVDLSSGVLTSPNLASELRFLQDLGAAVPLPTAAPGTWLLMNSFRLQLYQGTSTSSGIFAFPTNGEPTAQEMATKVRRLAIMFRNSVLPTYIRASTDIAAELPLTVQEGNYLRQMISLFDHQIRELEARFPPP